MKRKRKPIIRPVFRFCALMSVAIAGALGTGCVSARMSDHQSNRMFREGRYLDAAARLEKAYEKKGPGHNDALLYLLDIGLSLHAAGEYEESNKWFLLADQLAEIKDYTSLAEEGATLLTGENTKNYKGEDFEKVLINTYLAINFAMLGRYEDAVVEAKRVNRKLHLMITEGKRKYQYNAFARYLSGVMYEADGLLQDAYIDYKQTLQLESDFPHLGRDLWRMAWALRMPDEARDWALRFNLTQEQMDEQKELVRSRSGKGEIIVIFQNGISPIKRPNPSFHRVPKFYPRANPVDYARVEINGRKAGRTHLLHDIESTAIRNLDEKYGAIIAKRIAGIAAKEVVAHQIGRQAGEGWGMLASLVMHVSDQADLRSWNLLPRDLQIARFVVEPGEHKVQLSTAGVVRKFPEQTVTVEPGKKVFLNFRYTPSY